MTAADPPAAVYLDHNATTPIALEVFDAMRPYLERHFGNPSSAHGYGAAAHEAVARARSEVAMLLGCEPESVVFTASGSEADNLAIKGVALAQRGEGDHVIDLLTVTGHKMYAPKGIGALYVRPGISLDPLIHGAGHEHGLRAGTENVPYIVGLGAACALAARRLSSGRHRDVARLRARFHAALRSAVPGLALNGHPEQRLPNTVNVSFPQCDGEDLLARTPSVAAATGSACHSGRTEPSAVLTAMGLDAQRALGAVRLSLGYDTTMADVDAAAAALVASTTAAMAGGPGPDAGSELGALRAR